MSFSRDTKVWPEVCQWAENRLAMDRRELESPGVSPERTEALRGRIVLLKDLLELPDADPDPPAPSHAYDT